MTAGKIASKLVKVVGVAAVIGAVLAVARIVLRVFLEKPDVGESHEGV